MSVILFEMFENVSTLYLSSIELLVGSDVNGILWLTCVRGDISLFCSSAFVLLVCLCVFVCLFVCFLCPVQMDDAVTASFRSKKTNKYDTIKLSVNPSVLLPNGFITNTHVATEFWISSNKLVILWSKLM